MSYRRFSFAKIGLAPATNATFATKQAADARTVADVATVARQEPETDAGTVADVANVAARKLQTASWPDLAGMPGGDDGGAFDERIALIAEGSGCSEEWAAALARLDPARPPKDVPARRWRQFLDDCGRFVDEWATKAADLGWTPLDLFGCNRDAPFARVDCAGLLWLVAGRRIVALTAETAVIETPGGGRLTYRRRPKIDDQAVVPWDLVP